MTPSARSLCLSALCSLAACDSGPAPAPSDLAASRDASVIVDAAVPRDLAKPADLAMLTSCAATRAQVLACGGELTCGAADFDAWCAAFEAATASAQKRDADVLCRTGGACDVDAVADCQYRDYVKRTLTAAQADLVKRFCATCEPGATTACEARAIAYDSAAGPDAVTDVFLAAWESSDALAKAMADACTGSAPDGGVAACTRAFGQCAGGVYIDAIPACPGTR